MKVMFLDESGDHSLVRDKIDKSYPMFVLAGCIFDFDYYTKTVEPEIEKLKIKHFGKTNIILRSYDIRKQKGDFAVLVDRKKREEFYKDLDKLISVSDFTIIAGAINKLKLMDKYHNPTNPYELCFQFILERVIMYIGRKEETLILRAESRETHNDRELAVVFEKFRQSGNNIIKPEEVKKKIIDLSFNQKTQNIAGHQIADLVAYPIGKKVLEGKKENLAFEIVEKKFHCKNGSYQNYGLKIFP